MLIQTLAGALLTMILSLMSSGFAKADEPAPKPSIRIHVMALDPDVDTQALTGGRKSMTVDSVPTQTQSKYALPSREVRERIFKEAGATTYVADMDEVDRDVLFKRARSSKVSTLTSEYPSIPAETLERLSDTIHRESVQEASK